VSIREWPSACAILTPDENEKEAERTQYQQEGRVKNRK
jgi:hypothetical protein